MLRVPQHADRDYFGGRLNKEILHMPARFAPFLFGFVLSAMMSLLVSGIATFRNAGFGDGFVGLWVNAWLPSWLIAFPVVLIVAPVARRVVGLVVRQPAAAQRGV
jgi:hypothetical protein